MKTKTLCLAVLLKGPASGYEIKKTLEEPPFSVFQEASFGSIYPALSQLAKDGSLYVREEPQEGKPAKKVYTLTDKGRNDLVAALCNCPAPDRFRSDFFFTLYHGNLLPPNLISDFIDQRIQQMEADAARIEECGCDSASAERKFIHRYAHHYYKSSAEKLKELKKLYEEEIALETREAGE